MQANSAPPAPQIQPLQQSNPLEQLKDIQLPDAISWWPLAPGWWLLGIVIIALIVACIYGLIHYRNKRRNKRLALKTLAELPNKVLPAQLNELLKRTCLSYFPEQQVANMAGDKWVEFLTTCLPEKQQEQFKLAYQQQYLSSFKPQQTETDKTLIRQWLCEALPPSNKTLKSISEHGHV